MGKKSHRAVSLSVYSCLWWWRFEHDSSHNFKVVVSCPRILWLWNSSISLLWYPHNVWYSVTHSHIASNLFFTSSLTHPKLVGRFGHISTHFFYFIFLLIKSFPALWRKIYELGVCVQSLLFCSSGDLMEFPFMFHIVLDVTDVSSFLWKTKN